MTKSALTRLPASCSVEDINRICDRDGGVIIEDWVSSNLLAQFNQEIDPWVDQHPGTDSGSTESDAFLGYQTKRLQALAIKAPSFVKLLTDERLLAFAESTIGEISPTMIMNNGEVIDIGPGESAQPMHRDDDAWNYAQTETPMMINTITALVDITPEMGATQVVPGSHTWSKDRTPQESEIVSAAMKAGSSLFFRGDTLHCGGANTSKQRRRALSLGICCGWLRPVENSYMNVSVEQAKALPERARRLLGYALYDASSVGGGYLGYYDMGDPASLFS
ncbi:MAG: phytanoyl-CoA dioxygenase family protein [Pseudomonadales bacterium]